MSTLLPQSAPALCVALAILIAALLGAIGGRARAVAPWTAMLGPVAVLLTGAVAAAALRGASGEPTSPYLNGIVFRGAMPFLPGLPLGWTVDGLSALMLIIVGFVALMVMVFSIGYMHGDEGYVRYYALLSLFTAAMTMLVISDSLVGIFIGWELVGACSYLLIGFWFDKPGVREAALKAFLVTRLGDVGFLLGLAVLWSTTGTLQLTGVIAMVPKLAPFVVTAAALLLFAGAAGKSAQFPLHVWLPDAMAGPTPVSALIHAATMVAAGVFLIVRMWPLFEASPAARLVILVLAVITALGAALAAVAQGDIKKVLAYSTISQLGFMFAALGAGAWGAAMFHLTTHAAFKALLFLGAGSVIHATDTQELSEMGGLARKMPITAATWLIGVGALAGVPPLSGFFSKDEIVHDVLFAQPIAGVLLLVAAFVTALYVSRVTLLAFFGKPRGEAHAHESGLTMAVPLVLLAIPAALAGFAGPAIASLLGEEAAPLSWPVAATSAGVAVTGLVVGWLIWRRGMEAERSVAARIPVIWGTLREAFRVDVIYGAVARGTVSFARSLASAFDQGVIDRTAEGTAVVTRGAGRFLTRLQYGDGQLYAMLVGAGFILMMAVAAWFGGGAR